MIDPQDFADKQMELAAEFGKHLLAHPELDAGLPEDSYIFFHVEGDSAFNEYSRQLADRRQAEEGMIPVCVRVRGLTPPQSSRLIDPQIILNDHPTPV